MDPATATLDASAIARLSIHTSEGQLRVQLGQTEHRINLVKRWGIPHGVRVLEIGCGQGDTTTVLATAVGPDGQVTALDPASLDYGSPFTLGQAQAHIKAGPLGSRVTFVQADPLAFLATTDEHWDVVVIAACLWYFPSPTAIARTLAALAPRAARLCVSEFALASARAAGTPNVLAVLTQAALECHKPVSTSNVRTVLSPAALKGVIADAGLRVVEEAVVKTPEGMFDGKWEVGAVLDAAFAEEICACVPDERQRAVVFALRDAVSASKEALAAQGIPTRTMDVWVATLQANT